MAGETRASAITISRKLIAKMAVPDSQAVPSKEYSHGEPTDQEQYLLEITNRARANPAAECGILLDGTDKDIQRAIQDYQVDIEQLKKDFSTYSARPPLAFNAQLMQSAQTQDQDMIDHDFQGHTGSDGSTLAVRFQRVGYEFSRGGENIFSYSRSLLHAQGAFLIDWGVPDLGHRRNILDLDNMGFREVGIRILPENDPRTAVGPLVITQDFGLSDPQVVFITGVVYRDNNKNQFYDEGEGLSGATVLPDHGEYLAVSSSSGGYAFPVAANSGEYRLKIVRSDLPEMTAEVTVTDQNVKADFRLGDPTFASINGTIVNDETGLPLSGVQVTLNPVDRNYTSDSDGGFFYTDLPATSYTITATLQDFEFQPNNFTISLSPGQVYRLQIVGKPVKVEIPPQADGITETIPVPAGSSCGVPAIVLLVMIGLGFGLLQNSFSLNPRACTRRKSIH